MSNIHLLPTDKPSRLFIDIDDNKLKITIPIGGEHMMNQNIYITSDEEIKEGDYAYHKTFRVGKIININGEDCFVTIKLNPKDGSITTPWKRNIPDIKKIILTTDQDLIKDDVQAIPDGFLEWFVKNPSCEEVDVVKGFDDGTSYGYNFLDYKIIIPKEEPSMVDKLKDYFNNTTEEQIQKDWDKTCEQTKGINSPTVAEFLEAQKQFGKQETLEEAAENYVRNEPDATLKLISKYSFKDGAKWQQEQILQFLYSEIIERRPYSSSKMCEVVIEFIEQLNTKK